MDHQTAAEVIACLPRDRTLYYYYRDRYSIGLLRQLARADSPLTVAELKKSTFAPLAQKPRVKAVLANLGNDRLNEAQLALHDYDPAQTPFVLTLGTWGSEHARRWRWKQVSRRGYNLVLQLNFCQQHDHQFHRLGAERDLFCFGGHPVSPRRNTLAWARIDFDLQSGAALIEEIQSDWIREVDWLAERAAIKLARVRDPQQETGVYRLKCPLRVTLDYCRFVLEHYQSIWAEAMLWAAIHFLRDEIGLRHIYYHTVESGRLLKHIDGTLPPQSLYTDLPRRFCFNKTTELPEFIVKERRVDKVVKRHPGLRLHQIEIA